MKIKIIWTFHNDESHEGDDFIDIIGYQIVAKYTDLIIFHSELSKRKCIARYNPKAKLVVMPHGNYDGIYPTARPKNVILQELGLSEDLPVICCLGMLRDYKGFDVASKAVALLDGKVQFICAGVPHPSFDLVTLQNLIQEIPGAKLIPRFISDQEFSDFAAISDAILLPYRKITGSGALLAALSFSRGVITSDLPYFREILIANSDAGMLVPQGDVSALAESISLYLAIDSNKRKCAARQLADQYDWGKVIISVTQVLKEWRNN